MPEGLNYTVISAKPGTVLYEQWVGSENDLPVSLKQNDEWRRT